MTLKLILFACILDNKQTNVMLYVLIVNVLVSRFIMSLIIVMNVIHSVEKHHFRRFHHQDVGWIPFLPEGFWEWKDHLRLRHKAGGNIRNGLFIMKSVSIFFLLNNCIKKYFWIHMRSVILCGKWIWLNVW